MDNKDQLLSHWMTKNSCLENTETFGISVTDLDSSMDLKTVVIIPTKGRPQEVTTLLNTLERQTVPPDMIVVSACDSNDIEPSVVGKQNVQILFGPAGLPAQRNRALSLVQGKFDIVIFFDDDFIPSRLWIARIRMLLATQQNVGCVTGRVLADGVTVGGLERSVGQFLVDQADSSEKTVTLRDHDTRLFQSPYGCNMAFRAKAIEGLWFDERLLLYGWLEDRDFGFRVATRTRAISTDFVWGVHLGTTRGRVSGFKFGYSQVVNPWYLMKKGSMTPLDLYQNIFFGLGANVLGCVSWRSHVDRWGRLKGNLVGIWDIILSRWAPERISEL